MKTFDIVEYKTILDSRGKKHLQNYTILKVAPEGSSMSYRSQIRYVRKDEVYVEITYNNSASISLKEKEPNSLYSMNYYYNSETMLLMESGRFFYKIPVGTYIKYDEQGNIKEQIDADEQYQNHCKFKIEDLVRKFQEELGIDLSNPFKIKDNDEIEVSLYIPKQENETGRYIVKIFEGYIPERKVYKTLRMIRIDCNTGEILKDTIESIENLGD